MALVDGLVMGREQLEAANTKSDQRIRDHDLAER
jgi:hypothetical protein